MLFAFIFFSSRSVIRETRSNMSQGLHCCWCSWNVPPPYCSTSHGLKQWGIYREVPFNLTTPSTKLKPIKNKLRQGTQSFKCVESLCLTSSHLLHCVCHGIYAFLWTFFYKVKDEFLSEMIYGWKYGLKDVQMCKY